LEYQSKDDSKQYIFEINPSHINTTAKDKNKKIDARFIDKSNGRFMDITCLHRKNDNYYDKNSHHYTEILLFPLQKVTFIGFKTFVPHKVSKILMRQYGPKVLNPYYNKQYYFEEKKNNEKVRQNIVGGYTGIWKP